LYHREVSEEDWLNEALAGFAEYYTSPYGTGNDSVYQLGDIFLQTPEIGLTHLGLSANQRAKYGAGGLFVIYLYERFGNDILARLQAESADSWHSVDKVLRGLAGVSANEVFADWVLANYVGDAERGYGYRFMDPLPTPAQPQVTLSEFPALHEGSLPQFSSQYLTLNVRGADRLALRLTQAAEAALVDTAPAEGDFFYLGISSDSHSSRLTRAIDLRAARSAWLEFRIWHDLYENYEYGYVQVSADNGKTWSILPGKHTLDDKIAGVFYDDGYTGRSGGWLDERISLSRYAGKEILLRFETLSDNLTSYKGMAIDDLRIETIDFHDGFESANSGWIEEGWIRTDNRLPNNTWLQVIQETEADLEVTRSLMTGSGELAVDLLPDVDRVVVAISPVVLQTALETEYALEVNLLDADGNEIVIEFNCQLTTTAGLNFRDAPNGTKIGLVQQGAALWALDRSGDWFQVDYESQRGWIHGDYVTRTGNCP
ncbi:MAG: immune inhibitor A, partial [Chloroflexota bacterium]|nr:immune inhibitor A [Chloroflexota bacterium]